ncbi:MAG: hypothetical protein CL424_06080 [Acidimicrobiaceae bacterium]|nr:hypothetical protein [Acidimicrobiaceae bacterium]
MVPEDLLFWIAPLADSPVDEPSVLCGRHADAMVVPRGWTLDDRRENALRLFKPRPVERPEPAPRRSARRARSSDDRPEQLQIDGTGEIARPAPPEVTDHESSSEPGGHVGSAPWQPAFDHDDDLNGLLEVSSPLLSRAFRGTDRPRR